MVIEELTAKAAHLAGRPVEVEKLKDGSYIVLFMSLTSPPPPKAATPEKALENFIAWMEGMPQRDLPVWEEPDDSDKEPASEPDGPDL